MIGTSSLKLSKSTNIKIMLDSVKFMLIVIIKMIPTPTYINNWQFNCCNTILHLNITPQRNKWKKISELIDVPNNGLYWLHRILIGIRYWNCQNSHTQEKSCKYNCLPVFRTIAITAEALAKHMQPGLAPTNFKF